MRHPVSFCVWLANSFANETEVTDGMGSDDLPNNKQKKEDNTDNVDICADVPAFTTVMESVQSMQSMQSVQSVQSVQAHLSRSEEMPTASESAGAKTFTPEQSPPKLDALTSLRFFAAMMIFVYHALLSFNCYYETPLSGVALAQGVSFFFVLSGFILTYVHPKLETTEATNQFMLARFARIWPTHLVAFLLTIILMPPVCAIPHALPVAIAQLLMIHAWFFVPWITSAFNNVSWTISIELFFYLSFPFLIKDLLTSKKPRWACALLLSFTCIVVYLILTVVTKSGLSGVYVNANPFVRLAEFLLGMALCRLFTKHRLVSAISRNKATLLELLSLVLIAAAVCLSKIWPGPTEANVLWAIHNGALIMGGAPAYGMLIFLIATEKGWLAKLLKNTLFVRLGEISFSLYMIHVTIISSISQFRIPCGNLPDLFLPLLALFVSVIAADLNFRLVETPCRHFITGLGRKADRAATRDESAITKASPWSSGKWRILIAEVLVLSLVGCWLVKTFRFISPAQLGKIVSHSVPSVRDIVFGGRFKLCGVKVSKKKEGLYLDAAWQSTSTQRLTCGTTITLYSANGEKLNSKLYAQDNFTRAVTRADTWEDIIMVPSAKLDGARYFTLAVYDPLAGSNLSILNNPDKGDCIFLALP